MLINLMLNTKYFAELFINSIIIDLFRFFQEFLQRFTQTTCEKSFQTANFHQKTMLHVPRVANDDIFPLELTLLSTPRRNAHSPQNVKYLRSLLDITRQPKQKLCRPGRCWPAQCEPPDIKRRAYEWDIRISFAT